MPARIDEYDIIRHVGHVYLARGKAIEEEGLVLTCEWDDDEVWGQVGGSRADPYHSEISFVGEAKPRLKSICTCPLAGACKHVAALLLRYIKETKKAERRARPLIG